MNRKEILETMERTRGSVLHNGNWYRRPEDVPEDDVLAGDDPANKEVVARDLQAQIEGLQLRLNRLATSQSAAPPRETLRKEKVSAPPEKPETPPEEPETPAEEPETPAEKESVQAPEASPPGIPAEEVTGEPTVVQETSHGRGRRRG